MKQKLKNKIEWIDRKIESLIDQELPYSECMDFLVGERDKLTAQMLKEEFGKMDWEAK